MSQAIIRKAFESRLKTWAVANGIAIAYENVNFTAPDAVYLRSFMLPAETRNELINGEHRSYKGVYQVSIYMPSNSPIKSGEDMAADISALFPQVFTQDGIRITMLNPLGQRPALQDGARLTIPVSGSYRADIIL